MLRAHRVEGPAMGYHVRPCVSQAQDPDRCRRARAWRLQFIQIQQGVRHTRDIPAREYAIHGFSEAMTIDQAKHQRNLANSRLRQDRTELKRIAAAKRYTERTATQLLHLDPGLVTEFEERVIFQRLSRGDNSHKKRSKLMSHWHAAKDMVCALQIDPSDWHAEADRFYTYLGKQAFSPGYAQRILRIVNNWGYFLARKRCKPFLAVPAPRGMDLAFIANAYHEKTRAQRAAGQRGGKKSAPLSPSELVACADKVRVEHFRWIWLTVWFGLRPPEVDKLKDATACRIEWSEEHKLHVLWVYQSKLITVEPEYRWKAIPCRYPEQVQALDWIRDGSFQRPLCKTVQLHLGGQFTLYAGRKGFEDHMQARGHSLETVAEWMGHQTIERTWRNYRKKKRVRI